MFLDKTYFKLNIRTRNSLFRKFNLLYSRLNKIQLSTGIKTTGIAVAFTLISSISSGQNIAREWVENPEGTAAFNSGFYQGITSIMKFVDIDGDGDDDLFLGGYIRGYKYKFYRNQGLNAEERFVFDDHSVDSLSVLPLKLYSILTPPYIAFYDNDNDNDLDIYATNPTNSGAILFYKNTSNGDTLRFELTTGTENKFDTLRYVHSLAFADIDNDNDIDALFMTESDTVRYFEHAADTFAEQLGTDNPFSGLTLENPTMDFKDIDGDNDIDAIAHDCNDLVFLENTTVNERQQFVINTTDTLIKGTNGRYLYPSFADLDEDNDKDLFISDYLFFLINNFYYYEYNATDSVFKASASDLGITTPVRSFSFDVPRFIDFDNDNDLDLYMDNISDLSPIPNRLFVNVGTSTNPKFQQTALEAFGIPQIILSTEAFVDIDGDDDLDMFYFDNNDSVKMYKNIGSIAEPNLKLQNATNNPLSDITTNTSIKNINFADIDNDGDFDLVTAIKNQIPFIHIRENIGTPNNADFSSVSFYPNPFSLVPYTRAAYTLEFFDYNGDNKKDLIFGNHHPFRPGGYHIFNNTSNDNTINFELITEAPLRSFFSALGTFAMVNLFGESSPSIVIDEVYGLSNLRDTIRYYNSVEILFINPRTYSINEESQANTIVGEIDYTYHGDSTITLAITQGNIGNAFDIRENNIIVRTPEAFNYDNVRNRIYNLTIQASDGIYSVNTAYTINITQTTNVKPNDYNKYMKVYPSPAQDELYIDIKDNLGNKVHITLIDNSGSIVYDRVAFANTTVQINTSDLEAGIYFVEIITDNKKIAEKVIIE